VVETPAGSPAVGRLTALLLQRCPKCREGPIFRGRMTINRFCPVCELRLVREPGYTTVAIEISYLFSLPLLLLLYALVWLITRWPLEWVIVGASLLYLPFTPAIFRYSRVIWIHLDQAFDPGR
jgi:uncharacterized protein (DUF983 family)